MIYRPEPSAKSGWHAAIGERARAFPRLPLCPLRFCVRRAHTLRHEPRPSERARMTHLVGDHIHSGSINGIDFDVWEAADTGSHIELYVRAPTGTPGTVIGGGAWLASSGPGNMLTASSSRWNRVGRSSEGPRRRQHGNTDGAMHYCIC